MNNPRTPADILRTLTGKQHILLLESGDHCILELITYMKLLGKTTILLQDQGGWLTYKDYAKKNGLTIIELQTDNGIISPETLTPYANANSFLLINSLTGYCAEQPIEAILDTCNKNNCTIINDISGSIGTDVGRIGNILICSFGKDKPVNNNYGGCIAANEKLPITNTFDKTRTEHLTRELELLPRRRAFLTATYTKIKQDLKKYNIIHRTSNGINVIVAYQNENEKRALVEYCTHHAYPYTFCPRYIRVNTPAVSIEVKRLHEKQAPLFD